MAGDHDAEHSSRSPRRASFGDATDTNIPSQDCATERPSFARHASSFSMPSIELLQYANKGSVKVNVGLSFGDSADQASSSGLVNVFCSNKPAVNIEFAQLIAPIVAPEPEPSTDILVDRLLHPPAHAFVHDTMSIHWVLGAVGKQHFKFRTSDERYVLKPEADLRRRGISLGMPLLFMEWLSGDDETLSATEQGMHLTQAFFRDLYLKL